MFSEISRKVERFSGGERKYLSSSCSLDDRLGKGPEDGWGDRGVLMSMVVSEM